MEMSGYPVGGMWKRSLDCVVALTALVILSPIMLATALLILITMGRPIFSAQQTIGFNKSVFGLLRFRTVRVACTSRASDRQDPLAFESEFGKTLRESGLDGLPQLINILRGDMSFVGPAPLSASQFPAMSSDAKHYVKARPGLTGIWQIRSCQNTSSSKAVCDCFYVHRCAPALDAFIISQTLAGIFSTRRDLQSGVRWP
jgi:exopolysaccharide production protein ExoY